MSAQLGGYYLFTTLYMKWCTNDELQKWRIVMDCRLSVAKSQIEPKQRQIVDLRQQIAADEGQLRWLKPLRRTLLFMPLASQSGKLRAR
jgi:hypothetical protein